MATVINMVLGFCAACRNPFRLDLGVSIWTPGGARKVCPTCGKDRNRAQSTLYGRAMAVRGEEKTRAEREAARDARRLERLAAAPKKGAQGQQGQVRGGTSKKSQANRARQARRAA